MVLEARTTTITGIATKLVMRALRAGVSAVLAFVFFSTSALAVEPIKFGTTQALTGHYEDFGVQQLRGLQMWVEDVNERGALLGRPVSLTYYDDYSRDAGAVKGVIKLLKEDNVEFLIGPYSSSLTLEASQIAEAFNVPMVATGASSEEIWSRGLQNVFGIDTPTGNYLEGFTLAQQVGAKSVALIYADTEFPREVAQSMRDKAKENGLSIVFDESYPPPERNFSALADKLARVNADVIFGASYFEDSVAITRALKAKGVKPKMLAFTVGPALREFGDVLGEDAEGVIGLVQWLRSIRLPGAQDFAYRYRQRYGENPGVHAAIGYSAGQVMETAIRLAGTTEHAAVRTQLRTMFFRSLLGKYQVDANGRQIGKHNYLLQWQDNTRRLISPRQLAERPLVHPLP